MACHPRYRLNVRHPPAVVPEVRPGFAKMRYRPPRRGDPWDPFEELRVGVRPMARSAGVPAFSQGTRLPIPTQEIKIKPCLTT